MPKSLQYKLILILCVIFASFYLIIPSISWYSKKHTPDESTPERVFKLGLDLQGGIRLLLEVEVEKVKQENRKDVVPRALEIIRNRIDQFGVSEPIITKQGEKWIVVQLPGIKEPKRAIEIIGKTAQLEFRLVSDSTDLENPPEGYTVLKTKDGGKLIVSKEPQLTGAYLKDARVEIGGSYNLPYIGLEFTKEGGKKFAKITGENVGKRLAIVLDGIIQSAPNIRERIPNGRAIIEGMFSLDEAKDLALVLRAGALPAPVKIIENRTIGPTLGSDSVRRGLRAVIVGFCLVIVFMLIYYKKAGILADIALLLNLLILGAVLSLLEATLTLPGIAGIVLTIGTAVDANVLIFARIKEELKAGKTPLVAIDSGYQKAFSTILDANITTLIAAGFLLQFGSGPIKGFAITLMIGIFASMFTAIFVTHTIWDAVLFGKKVERISI
ncbi:MAG: protein translocase subunit SecD [Elusimicrobia bacterium]|nr:protein translocase subunit SecD [Elusimicrobiota bacterium]